MNNDRFSFVGVAEYYKQWLAHRGIKAKEVLGVHKMDYPNTGLPQVPHGEESLDVVITATVTREGEYDDKGVFRIKMG